jgi:alpha-D-xyloside xylohydrolase
MAALCFDFATDATIWEAPHQYLFGRELLVCPVTDEGATEQRVYLPAGDWTDVWSRERHTGGEWVTVSAPIDRIPVFACSNGDAWHALFTTTPA